MRPLILCIGGTATNGPGLRADEEAVLAAGGRFVGIASAHTVQDAAEVKDIGARPPAQWRSEALAAVLRESPGAIKTGLLPGAEHLAELFGLLARLRGESPELPFVLDPVIAASTGERFLDESGVDALRSILEERPVVCPNLLEAAELTGVDFEVMARDPATRLMAGERLLRLGAAAVVVKGGHGLEDPVLDLVMRRGEAPIWLERGRKPGNLRGSGCRHASSLATHLARGETLEGAARKAGAFVRDLVR